VNGGSFDPGTTAPGSPSDNAGGSKVRRATARRVCDPLCRKSHGESESCAHASRIGREHRNDPSRAPQARAGGLLAAWVNETSSSGKAGCLRKPAIGRKGWAPSGFAGGEIRFTAYGERLPSLASWSLAGPVPLEWPALRPRTRAVERPVPL